ncbi:MAG: hypothetical protein HN392_01495 [Anaerolineae bacterium]|nr:hypothetical protein [Anaerolineae bacterium]MBT7782618.1 hypothetical protein [Anaerolineae bacterium]
MGNIEKQGTGWLSSTVAESKILEPYFKENDRTPSFDGYIFVYDGSLKKEDLKEHLPVQIKSIVVDEFSSDRVSYSLDISDIQNYYNIRGTILFVVEICGKERKGFIKSLLPSELKNILAELKLRKSENPSKALHLTELDTSTLTELEYICEHFLIHRKLQFSTIEHSLSITDASAIEIPIISDGTHIEEYLFSKEHLLYGKPAKETVLRYIQNAQITSISQSLNRNITINSKMYFSQYSETRVSDGKFFEFGEKIRIDIHDGGTGNLSYKLTGTVSEHIKVLSFLLDFVETGNAHIGDGKFEINNIENEESFLNGAQNNLKHLKDIEALFNSFRIDLDRLNISLLKNRDIANLGFLLDVMIHKKRKETNPFQQGFNVVRVGNISLCIFAYKKANDTCYTFLDTFEQHDDLNFQSQIHEGNLFASSMYVILKQDLLTLVDNLDLSTVLMDIKKVVYSTEHSEVTIIFGLELIKAYDASNREEFLDAAFNIFEWLQQMEHGKLIPKLNELQIIRRQRAYTKDEKTFLLQEQRQNADDNRILCAINILLENKSEAESNFAQLKEEEKEEFMQYPIFTLAKQLSMFKNDAF